MKFFYLTRFDETKVFYGRDGLYFVLVIADRCAPCDSIKSELKMAIDDNPSLFSEISCFLIKPNLEDKREIGKFMRSGYHSFPTFKIFFENSELYSLEGVLAEWRHGDLARIIVQKTRSVLPKIFPIR